MKTREENARLIMLEARAARVVEAAQKGDVGLAARPYLSSAIAHIDKAVEARKRSTFERHIQMANKALNDVGLNQNEEES